MKRLVIIGAGASIDSSQSIMPSANNFFQKIRGNSELSHLLSQNNIQDMLRRHVSSPLDFTKHYKIIDKINIEELFTLASLEAELDPTNKDLFHLTELIKTTIATLSGLSSKPGNYGEFVKDFIDGDTSVITFNWDILLDEQLPNYCDPETTGGTTESLHWEYRKVCTAEVLNTWDGMGIPTPTENIVTNATYLKLHGSVDLVSCKNSHCRTYMFPFRIKNPTAEYFCNSCYERVAPYLIPPIQNKPIRQFPHIRRSWMLARQLVLQAEEVCIWGYSLPQTDHWSTWLIKNLWNERSNCKKLVIINPEAFRILRNTNKELPNNTFRKNFLPNDASQTQDKIIEYYESYDLFKKMN